MLSVLSKRKAQVQTNTASSGLWRLAVQRLKADRIAMASLFIVFAYFIVLLLSVTGVIAPQLEQRSRSQLRAASLYGR